jgi:hypothetical protein
MNKRREKKTNFKNEAEGFFKSRSGCAQNSETATSS